MNSYPHEFLAHHLPLMFVGGLTEGDKQKKERRDSIVETGQALVTKELASAEAQSCSDSSHASDPAGSADKVRESSDLSPQAPVEIDPFQGLRDALRNLFEKQSEKGKLWVREEEKDLFRIMLVDKNIRLPPRKVPPPAISSSTSTSTPFPNSSVIPHSALSPLSMHSPVHPDGLISPIWVRKHSELIPSVFVMFLRLEDFGRPITAGGVGARERSGSTASGSVGGNGRSRSGSKSSLASQSGTLRSPDIAQEQGFAPTPTQPAAATSSTSVTTEKQRLSSQSASDAQLITEIASYKKRTAERGIKFTVVLLAAREMLDDPGLDARLSGIRRNSGLDSRASLFVLTPVAEEELVEFAASLQDSLYDPALEFYSNHYKRNRRKRSRLPQNPQIPPYTTTAPALGGGRPLSTQGWAVRYDYKAGVFAEMRGEIDLARKHLEDSWHELVALFTSTVALPPRTKRWAEAKVLADCIAVKICRLYLYEADAQNAAGFFHQHLTRFSDFSKGWGIGEETFEYWSWMARQYRIFAELVELALVAGLKLSSPLPTFTASQLNNPNAIGDESSLVTSAFNPAELLQHPGYYWLMAGTCNVRRRDTFQAIVESESSGNQKIGANSAPGFANEQKADHAAIIIELFTKAYTLYKGQRPSQTRMSLYVAYRIAETHAKAGQHEVAVKFFERIAKTYRREQWREVTCALQTLWLESARQSGSMDSVAQVLWAMMASREGASSQQGKDYGMELDSLLNSSLPSSTAPVEILLDGDDDLFAITSAFWTDKAVIGEDVPWSIEIVAASGALFGSLIFDSLEISFSDNREPVIFTHAAESEEPLGAVTTESTPTGCLRWTPGLARTFRGSASEAETGVLSISSCTLKYRKNSWEFHLKAASPPAKPLAVGQPWIAQSVQFHACPRSIAVNGLWATVAYCGETTKHVIHIENEDDRTLRGTLKVEVVEISKQKSTINFGQISGLGELSLRMDEVAPHASTDVVVRVTHPTDGEKKLKITLLDGEGDATDGQAQSEPLWQTTIAIQSTIPFFVFHDIEYKLPSSVLGKRLAAELEEISWETFIASSVQLRGARDVEVIRWRDVDTSHPEKRLTYSSIAHEGSKKSSTMTSGDATSIVHIYETAITETERGIETSPIPSGQVEIDWKISGSVDEETFTTSLALPSLALPTDPRDVVAQLQAPDTVQLAQAFSITLVVFNASETTVAGGLSLQVEASEAFVWKGSRHTRVPLLLPRREWILEMTAVPVGQTGLQPLPRIHLLASVEGEAQRELPIVSFGGRLVTGSDGFEVVVQP